MSSHEFLNTLNDLTALFTARFIALPLLFLLIYKLYLIEPDTLLYACALAALTCLSGARWGIAYLTKHPKAFMAQYTYLKKQEIAARNK